jgi:2-phosphosulfolactate phosphatase
MNVDVVFLPSALRPEEHLSQRTVVVFDVLRATTSMVAALDAGVAEIRVFADTKEALASATEFNGVRLLCGEVNCLAPPGFDVGNSPREFRRELHAGRTMFMSTTNGTRAIVAARSAPLVLAGALVNAAAVARRCATEARDVTLLCAGTNGAIAMEDVLGAGAVIARLPDARLASDSARIALRLFDSQSRKLPDALRDSAGGRNVIAATLARDIDFAAQLDAFEIVPVIHDRPLRAMRG